MDLLDLLADQEKPAAWLQERMAALDEARRMARALTITPKEAERHGLPLKRDGHRRTAFELLAYPGIGIADLTPKVRAT